MRTVSTWYKQKGAPALPRAYLCLGPGGRAVGVTLFPFV